MTCLDCGKEMATYGVHTASISAAYDVCEACGGLWLDKGELDKVADPVDSDFEYVSAGNAAPRSAGRLCPRCPSEPLLNVRFSGDDAIVLERCDNCGGFWLQGEQVGQIEKLKNTGLSRFIANTHLPHYNYAKRDSAETDFIVPVVPVPGARHMGTAKHQCPNHEFFLDIWEAYGIKFETCPKCAGLWLREKELKVLKDKTDDGNLRWMNDEIEAIDKTSGTASKRSCPEGHGLMLSTHFGNSGITIERCDTCHGVWLDRGEFNDIVGYLEDEMVHETSADLKQKVAEEVKAVFRDKSKSKLTEILDAKSAISALISASIFEHPKLADFLLRANGAERVIGGN